MRLILKIILILSFYSSAFAHQDRVITLSEDGRLEGLPQQYQPANLDLTLMAFQIGMNTFNFPACVSKYFPADKKYKIQITSSWYHDRSLLPPYIKIKIFPHGRNFEYGLLFELDTLKPIEFQVMTHDSEHSMSYHALKINERCQQSIESSYSHD